MAELSDCAARLTARLVTGWHTTIPARRLHLGVSWLLLLIRVRSPPAASGDGGLTMKRRERVADAGRGSAAHSVHRLAGNRRLTNANANTYPTSVTRLASGPAVPPVIHGEP